MVATIRDITIESFLARNFRLEPASLTSADWWLAISEARYQLMALPKFDQLKSIKKLLCWEHEGIQLELDPRLINFTAGGKPSPFVVYGLLHTCEAFPRGWEDARDRGIDKEPITTHYLLIQQDSMELMHLTCVWEPEAHWGDRGRIPDTFVYRAISASLKVLEEAENPQGENPFDRETPPGGWNLYHQSLLGQGQKMERVGVAIIMQMRNLAEAVVASLEHEANLARRRQADLEGRLHGLGAWRR